MNGGLRKAKIVVVGMAVLVFLLNPVCRAQSSQPKIRKNEVKVALLSLFSGTSKVTFQRWLFDHQSVEFTVGIVGLGFDALKESNPKGTAWRLAYKFVVPSNDNTYNPMCGYYFKPELCYSVYSYDHPSKGRLDVNYAALMWVIGYDWVKDWFDFDIYAGVGYAFGENNYSYYHHGFITLNSEVPIALTAGFRVGVAF